ncbi:zinc ribbon domain-containing protein [Streptomyces syringium]|uniref:transposase n=1 Tax=Streptomyces syringium TaxID=76729 RepID=UPI003AAF0F89
MHAHTAQAVAYDLADVIVLARKSKAQGREGVRLPWREKHYRRLVFTTGFGWKIIQGGRLALSLGRGRERIVLAMPEFTDRNGVLVTPDRWGEILLCWDITVGSWSLRIAHRVPDDGLPDAAGHDSDQPPGSDVVTIAIDEGIVNSMALATRTPQGDYEVAVINGRAARAIKQRRNKGMARLQSKLSRCRNGSRRHRRLAAARKKVAGRTRQRLRDFNHQVTAKANRFIRDQVAAHVQANPAGTLVVVRLVVGDVRGVERNTRKGRRASRSTRQQLSQWERGTQERQVAYKTGLTVRHISERFSSQTCPYCLTRRKVRGRSYVCVNDNCCAPVLNRDAVGGVNIHTLAVNDGMYVPVSPETRIRVKYLRAQPGWSVGQRERHGFHQRVRHRAGEGRSREARSSARNRAPRTDQHVGAGVAVVPRQGNSTDNDGGADILRGVGRAIARTATAPV